MILGTVGTFLILFVGSSNHRAGASFSILIDGYLYIVERDSSSSYANMVAKVYINTMMLVVKFGTFQII